MIETPFEGEKTSKSAKIDKNQYKISVKPP